MNADTRQITGITLIEKALDFMSLTSDKSKWTFEKQKDNPPRFMRLQQLNVLLKFFTPETFDSHNIALGLDNLINGEFILHREMGKYDIVFNNFNDMNAEIYNMWPLHPKIEKWDLWDLQVNYTRIFEFKRRVNTLIYFNSGFLEGSGGALYHLAPTENFIKKLDTTHIDNFLSLVIDPLGRTISSDKIIRNNIYPTDDEIYNVDCEWV